MRVMITSTPNRAMTGMFPPIGPLSILKYARSRQDIVSEFFNVDGLRPEFDQIFAHILDFNPEILGISAVVSTSYAFTKKLATAVKEALPETLIVVGGPLAASAEILMKKAQVDLCVLGEGEVVFNNIISRARQTRTASDFADLPGIMLINDAGDLINTGYEAQLSADEIWDYDLEDLEATGTMDSYIRPLFEAMPNNYRAGQPVANFRHDPRVYEPHRRDKTMSYVAVAKGCVARCTFCHRWDKGIRHVPVDRVIKQMETLIERYNVGVFSMAAETFGADKRWLEEFIGKIEKFDILWSAGGARTNTFSEDWFRRIKESGCLGVNFGFESGSSKMLQIMEKKVDLEDNFKAMKNGVDVGFNMGMQFVLGMPGETEETVAETIEFIKYGITLAPTQNLDRYAVNYAMALPGTPLYEYGRHEGLIGKTIDGEEEYLLSISDRDAVEEITAVNFTSTPRLRWMAWRPYIQISGNYYYFKKFGKSHYFKSLLHNLEILGGSDKLKESSARTIVRPYVQQLEQGRSLPFSMLLMLLKSDQPGFAYMFFPVLFYHMRHFITLLQFLAVIKQHGFGRAFELGGDYLMHVVGRLWTKAFDYEYKSLRNIVRKDMKKLANELPPMAPLREGR